MRMRVLAALASSLLAAAMVSGCSRPWDASRPNGEVKSFPFGQVEDPARGPRFGIPARRGGRDDGAARAGVRGRGPDTRPLRPRRPEFEDGIQADVPANDPMALPVPG